MNWHVWYNGTEYKLSNVQVENTIASFKVFDMAYQYVTRLNGTNNQVAYSRWTV